MCSIASRMIAARVPSSGAGVAFQRSRSSGPCILGRNPLLELRQREPEQIPDPQQVAEASLVGRVVQSVRPLGPVAAGQQADLLVVADGAGRRADPGAPGLRS